MCVCVIAGLNTRLINLCVCVCVCVCVGKEDYKYSAYCLDIG